MSHHLLIGEVRHPKGYVLRYLAACGQDSDMVTGFSETSKILQLAARDDVQVRIGSRYPWPRSVCMKCAKCARKKVREFRKKSARTLKKRSSPPSTRAEVSEC